MAQLKVQATIDAQQLERKLKELDQKLDELNRKKIEPKGDGSGLDDVSQKADKAKKSVEGLEGKNKSMTASFQSARGAITAVGAVIGALVMVYNAVQNAIDAANEKIAEHIESLSKEVEAGNKAAEKRAEDIQSLMQLSAEYERNIAGSEALRKASEGLQSAFEAEGKSVENLAAQYRNLTKEKIDSLQKTAAVNQTKADAALLGMSDDEARLEIGNGWGVYEYGRALQEEFKDVAKATSGWGGVWLEPLEKSKEAYIAFWDALVAKKKEYEESGDPEKLLTEEFQAIQKTYDSWQPKMEAVAEAENARNQADAFQLLWAAEIKSAEGYRQFTDEVKQSTQYSDALKQTILATAQQVYPEYAKSLSETTAAQDLQTEALASQNDLITIHTSNLKELQKIREKDGKLTQEQADMLKGLFSDTKDYDKAVVQTADGLIVKQDALDGLIDSEQEQIEALWGTADAIDEANDAFLKFLNSLMNLSEAGDELDAFKKLWQNAASDIENGLMNTNAVKAFVSNWFSGDVQREIQSGAVDLAEIMNSGLTEALMQGGKGDYGSRAATWLYQDLAKTGHELRDENGEMIASFQKVGNSIETLVPQPEKLAEAYGLSTEAINAFGWGLTMYDTSAVVEGNEKAAASFDDIRASVQKATGKVNEAGQEISSIDVGEFVRASADAKKSAQEISTELLNLQKDSTVELSVELDADTAETDVQKIIDGMKGNAEGEANSVTITAKLDDQATAPLDALKTSAEAAERDYTMTFRIVTVGSVPQAPKTRFASGTQNAPGGEALVNELGPELISENGRAYIANGGEPAIVDLNPGAIVLDHQKTQKVLNNRDLKEPIDAYAGGFSATVPTWNGGGKNNGSSSAAKTSKTAKEDDPWKIVQDYYNYADDLADRAKDHLDYLVDKIQNEWDDLKEPLDDQIDALERVNDQLDRQATLLEREQDNLTKPLQDQIDAMNDAKDIQDEQLELAEKQKAVEEARSKLQNAQNERTIRTLNSKTGQWEWLADKSRVQDAQDAVASAEKELADYQYELEIRALERQISGIEDDYQKKLDAIEEQQTANEDRIYDLEQQFQDMEDYYKAQMKPLERQIETMERQMADYAELWAQIAITQDLPEGDLNAAINRLGNLTPEQKQSIRNIIEGVKGVPNGSGAAGGSSGGEVASAILPGKSTWESALSDVGAIIGGKDMRVYGEGTTVYNNSTVTNHDSHNITVNGLELHGDKEYLTLGDLDRWFKSQLSTGIYAGE